MAYYKTVSDSVERDYVVIKHSIPNVNSNVMGVRFRNSWAVVEKNSKLHHRLKKLPMLKNSREEPLSFLKKLTFINRPLDVKLIYGADVYAKYVRLDQAIIKKEEEDLKVLGEKLHLEDETKCKFRVESGSFCKSKVHTPEISSYCPIHLLNDPRLEEINFTIPTAMDKKERKAIRKTAMNKLKALSKQQRSEENYAAMVQESPAEEAETTSE